ncbi:MAG TPA: [acyl-carrier-protein] S-malonyltransferase [Planctomycetaceae bacterium]|nr:[acyl-carrier-protein] S-malonyltransferase [Planctomycetaceae bacterium]
MARTAFLFPGQGAQFVGMGRTAVAQSPAAARLFVEASEILGYDLLQVCQEGPKDRLDSTAISQPAIYVASLAALEQLRQESPEVVAGAEFAAGLSLGEYTALTFAGALSFADGVRLVQRRGAAMQAAADANPSGMVSILMLERPQVEAICTQAREAGPLWVANYLCPGNTVLSGSKEGCARALQLAEEQGAKTATLAVAGAFHTELMRPADQRLAEALAETRFAAARIPVYSNVDARPHQEPHEFPGLLVQQVLAPVLWEDCVRGLLGAGVEKFYEIGPGKVLKGLMKRIDRKVECVTVGGDG